MNAEDFCRKFNIPYITSGPNVARSNIAVSCCFCSNDPSFHMGIKKDFSAWGCWRDSSHRGRSPHRLIRALIGCSQREAELIVGTVEADLSEFDRFVNNLIDPSIGNTSTQSRDLELPDEFKCLRKSTFTSRKMFLRYLARRKYLPLQRNFISYYFNLHYCTSGDWRGRVIIPVYTDKGLVTWTGRSIYPRERVKYLTLSHREKEGGVKAIERITDTLLDYEKLSKTKANKLIITEGPFDAIRITCLGYKQGIYGTCLFTKTISDTQKSLLAALNDNFNQFILLLDHNEIKASMEIARELSFLSPEVIYLPEDIKDPGMLNLSQFRKLMDEV